MKLIIVGFPHVSFSSLCPCQRLRLKHLLKSFILYLRISSLSFRTVCVKVKMSDSETRYQPLLGAPSQQAAVNVPEQGGRSSRAYKVAGITLLACILIAGQAVIAYFLLSQGSDIKSLEEQNNKMQVQLTKGRSVASVPMRKHMPMNALPDLVAFSEDKDTPAGPPPKTVDTDCQREASGQTPSRVPGFRPSCDEHGLYRPQQCYMENCWCVNPVSGMVISGPPANCDENFLIGGRTKILALPDADE
ncbi:uncharacterized protein LOC121510964 [Cheilinus undulatus]|uniref:uncharacterized protein LOC121510964 n=1 Tax=Cheilinus undulatus TaxID=241271 RepID=UPI001BD33CA1|nr:uncharacterized protein LOC121510964 [Cheilinus undulatus]